MNVTETQFLASSDAVDGTPQSCPHSGNHRGLVLTKIPFRTQSGSLLAPRFRRFYQSQSVVRGGIR